jgi:hypothetical protein
LTVRSSPGKVDQSSPVMTRQGRRSGQWGKPVHSRRASRRYRAEIRPPVGRFRLPPMSGPAVALLRTNGFSQGQTRWTAARHACPREASG